MSEASDWLAARLEGAPEPLRARMESALAAVPADAELHEQLAQAALACLRRGIDGRAREHALDLLSADALFTHACEAAAEAGSEASLAFAASWDAHRFAALAGSQ